jgi:NAD(P)-dependent dehydrogenase (short-subunit alcohol dehydrogenase family)
MATPVEPKVALIIGAGTALGAEIARGLASSGMQLALNDQLPTRIEPLAAEITAGGGRAIAFSADVSRKLSLQTMLQEVLEKYARIDMLVFIANVQPPDVILDMDEWDWHRTIDLNLTAAFLCMQSVGRVMRELGGGVIVNVLNVPGPTSHVKSDSAAYAVAAAGVEALSRKADKEFAAHGIRVQVARSAEEALQILNSA